MWRSGVRATLRDPRPDSKRRTTSFTNEKKNQGTNLLRLGEHSAGFRDALCVTLEVGRDRQGGERTPREQQSAPVSPRRRTLAHVQGDEPSRSFSVSRRESEKSAFVPFGAEHDGMVRETDVDQLLGVYKLKFLLNLLLDLVLAGLDVCYVAQTERRAEGLGERS